MNLIKQFPIFLFLLFHKYFCKQFAIDLKNLKELICKFLGHNSLTIQILVFCEFTVIPPVI